MLDPTKLRHAVNLQQRSYRLLRWTAKAVESGFLHVEAAHNYLSLLPDAARDWLLRHYENIPPDARPKREDIECFSAFFSTYLENSFDLVADPGSAAPLAPRIITVSVPMCGWQVNAPSLKMQEDHFIR